MILIILAWDRLSMSWVGKLFRPKAAFSIFVPLKAAVKVNLPISMLYDEVCRWTTATRSTCGFILTSENQGRSKVQGNHDHCQVPEILHIRSCPHFNKMLTTPKTNTLK